MMRDCACPLEEDIARGVEMALLGKRYPTYFFSSK